MPPAVEALGHFLWVHFHKDWFDPATFIFALLFLAYKAVRTKGTTLSEAGRTVMDGSAIIPLLMLTLSAVSRHALEALLNGSRVTLSIAGFFALTAVLQIDKKD